MHLPIGRLIAEGQLSEKQEREANELADEMTGVLEEGQSLDLILTALMRMVVRVKVEKAGVGLGDAAVVATAFETVMEDFLNWGDVPQYGVTKPKIAGSIGGIKGLEG